MALYGVDDDLGALSDEDFEAGPVGGGAGAPPPEKALKPHNDAAAGEPPSQQRPKRKAAVAAVAALAAGEEDSRPERRPAAKAAKSSAAAQSFFLTPAERKRRAAEDKAKAEADAKVAAERAAQDAALARERRAAEHAAALRQNIEETRAVDAKLSHGKALHPFFARKRAPSPAVAVAGQSAEDPIEIADGSDCGGPEAGGEREAAATDAPLPPSLRAAAARPASLAPLPPSHVGRPAAGDAGPRPIWPEGWLRPESPATTTPVQHAVPVAQRRGVLVSSRAAPAPPSAAAGPTEEAPIEALASHLRQLLDAQEGAPAYDPELEDADAPGLAVATSSAALERRMGWYRERAESSRAEDALWTECFRPDRAADVVGNAAPVGMLLRWLGEWRECIATEGSAPAAKAARARSKRARTPESESGSWFQHDNSDSGAESGDEEGSTEPIGGKHTAVLLTGPVGAGKTAAVYACAREMGFKVLEVNPSERRAGAGVMSRFSEATQSKRISSKKANPLQAMFGKAAVKGKPEPAAAEGKVKCKGKRAVIDEEDDDSSDGSLALAGRSAAAEADKTVILFEEVDFVSDDERGFLTALGELVKTAKRPIVLTSNTPVVAALPNGLPLARLAFSRPTVPELTQHVALATHAEGAAMTPAETESLVQACRADIRRTLLAAQLATRGVADDGVVEHGTLSPEAAAHAHGPRVLGLGCPAPSEAAAAAIEEYEACARERARVLERAAVLDALAAHEARAKALGEARLAAKLARERSRAPDAEGEDAAPEAAAPSEDAAPAPAGEPTASADDSHKAAAPDVMSDAMEYADDVATAPPPQTTVARPTTVVPSAGAEEALRLTETLAKYADALSASDVLRNVAPMTLTGAAVGRAAVLAADEGEADSESTPPRRHESSGADPASGAADSISSAVVAACVQRAGLGAGQPSHACAGKPPPPQAWESRSACVAVRLAAEATPALHARAREESAEYAAFLASVSRCMLEREEAHRATIRTIGRRRGGKKFRLHLPDGVMESLSSLAHFGATAE